MRKMKPCPRCGLKNRVRRMVKLIGPLHERVRIECPRCGKARGSYLRKRKTFADAGWRGESKVIR